MNRIKELRMQRGWLQSALAEKLNTGKNTISRYETEQRQLDPEMIHALCDLFGVTSDYLLCRSAVPHLSLSDAEWALVSAYNRASLRDRELVDHILAAYMETEKGETAK